MSFYTNTRCCNMEAPTFKEEKSGKFECSCGIIHQATAFTTIPSGGFRYLSSFYVLPVGEISWSEKFARGITCNPSERARQALGKVTDREGE